MLDTTHPQAIRDLEAQVDLERTLFVSASKSGSTLETRSHTDYFWEQSKNGELWAAITDPGSALEELALERGFGAIFAGEPAIGGRYSALSAFGMVPAALMGIDPARFLLRAQEMADACRSSEGNPGLELGLSLGEGWQAGRDKICIEQSDGGFGLWAEQLLAESTGKLGKGLIPAPGEPADGPDRQAQEVRIADPYELGQEFFRWEFATAVAGSILEINPFDQPDVQAAKDKTLQILASGDDPLVEPVSSAEELFAQAQRRRLRLRFRRSSIPLRKPSRTRPRSRSGRGRPRAASSRTASGRATCTRPGSCTRAARRRGSISRWSTTRVRSSRSPAGRSGSRS